MGLRVAVIGLGRGAVLTVPALAAQARIELVAGCDPDPAARAGFAARHGVPACETVEALLANADFDAAYIASPHEFHAAHTLAMAGAGKHVLVEKPMAVTLVQAASMIRAAETAGTVLIVGPSHGYDPPVEAAAALVASGAVGGVRLIHAFNYTDFLYRPRRPAELDTARGGGVILSQATHQIDMVRRIGASSVTSVRAWTGGWDARATEGAFTALLFFANGAVANLTYSGYARYDSDALAGWVGEMGGAKSPAAHGQARALLAAIDERQAKAARTFAAGAVSSGASKHHERFGSVLITCEQADLALTPSGLDIHADDGVRRVAVPLPSIPRAGVAEAFAHAVLDGWPVPFDGRWGLESLAICHAILLSAREGRDVTPSELFPKVSERTL